ncbi:MAG: NADH-quinone oxidoreductase subunit NuoE [Desulfobacteraceae bacterium]|jgi:NADH-quinone oxidoreductase subunit E
MLSHEEIEEITEALTHCERKQAAGVDALKVVQRHRGWVSDEALADVADVLDMSPAELDSVATFYSLIFRRKVGRHVILLCDSVSCWVMGYESIFDILKRKLGIGFGETTQDGRFTLLPHPCLGACERAPAMMVDNELYGPLDEGLIDRILSACD